MRREASERVGMIDTLVSYKSHLPWRITIGIVKIKMGEVNFIEKSTNFYWKCACDNLTIIIHFRLTPLVS